MSIIIDAFNEVRFDLGVRYLCNYGEEEGRIALLFLPGVESAKAPLSYITEL